MWEPPDPSLEIVEWLSTLHLSQYTSCFQQRGYHALGDCGDLTDKKLLELKVFPTGHRRRILRSLEALGVNQQSGDDEQGGLESKEGQRMPVPLPRHVYMKDKKRGASYQHQQPKEKRALDSEGSHTLPAGAGLGAEHPTDGTYLLTPQPAQRDPCNINTPVLERSFVPPSVRSSSSSSSESLSSSEIPSDGFPDMSSDATIDSVAFNAQVPPPELTEDVGRFHGEMVDNSIYEAQPSYKSPAGPRPTRSYRLRHRPVPQIPNQIPLPPQDRYAFKLCQ